MKTLNLLALTIFFVVLMAGHAFAVGEGFQVETFGTKYCGDFNSIKYNAKNNVNLWVYLPSESDVMVSFTPNFQPGTTFLMSLSQYLVSNRKTSFTGTADFEDGSYLTLQGITNNPR
jgi:hypothetical protein